MEDRNNIEVENRFVYEKGDLQFSDTQCGFCSFLTNDINICEKYPNGKPKEILKSEIKCEFLNIKDDGIIDGAETKSVIEETISDEKVESYINNETREYDEEQPNGLRKYKIVKLSDYPNLTEQELSFFRLKEVKDYDDLKEKVRNLLYERKIEKAKIMQAADDMNNSKMANIKIEIYYKNLMETQKSLDINKEYLSLPLLNINDKNNITLMSVIIANTGENEKINYYCQGYIENSYNLSSLPKCELFTTVEHFLPDISVLSSIPKGEYSNMNIADLKERYYLLLDKLKELVIKNINDITKEESATVLEFLKLYRYLETDAVQSYQSLHNDFIIWCMACSNVK